MRLLSSVHTGMHCQRGALDELLPTPRPIASVGSDSSMDTLCEMLAAVIGLLRRYIP